MMPKSSRASACRGRRLLRNAPIRAASVMARKAMARKDRTNTSHGGSARCVIPPPREDVVVVQAARAHREADLAGLKPGHLHLAVRHHLGAAVLVDDHGLHRSPHRDSSSGMLGRPAAPSPRWLRAAGRVEVVFALQEEQQLLSRVIPATAPLPASISARISS